MDTRKCQHCEKEKPLAAFRPCRQIASGYYWVCRTCQDIKREAYDRATGRLKDERE